MPFAQLARTARRDRGVARQASHRLPERRAGRSATRRWSTRCARPSSKHAGKSGLAEAVARNYAKLLAYKDEYEVARLYTDAAFQAQARAASSRATTS